MQSVQHRKSQQGKVVGIFFSLAKLFNCRKIHLWRAKHTHEKTLKSYHCIAWAFRVQLPAFLGLAELWKNSQSKAKTFYDFDPNMRQFLKDYIVSKCYVSLLKYKKCHEIYVLKSYTVQTTKCPVVSIHSWTIWISKSHWLWASVTDISNVNSLQNKSFVIKLPCRLPFSDHKIGKITKMQLTLIKIWLVVNAQN